MPKPLVDRLEGLAPSVAIEQRNPRSRAGPRSARPPRSTTTSGCCGRASGRSFCRICGAPVRRDTPQSAADDILPRAGGPASDLLPAAAGRPAHPRGGGRESPGAGLRARAGRWRAASSRRAPGRARPHPSEGVAGGGGPPRRRARVRAAGSPKAVATAFQEGEGVAVALRTRPAARVHRVPRLQRCDTPAATVTPALFSFNNPRGACSTCNGFGAVLEYDESLIIPDPSPSLAEGPSIPGPSRATSRAAACCSIRAQAIGADPTSLGQAQGGPPARAAPRAQGPLRRHLPFLKGLEEKRYKQYIRVFLRQYQLAHTCTACGGTRLNPDALAVRHRRARPSARWPRGRSTRSRLAAAGSRCRRSSSRSRS